MTAQCTNTAFHGATHHSGLVARILDMFAVRKQRRDLSRLDDRALRDIGVSRYQAQIESSRPAWDVPHYWMD